MSNINKYTTASMDFDAIKNDLKQFLQFQNEFSDYDFEGSGLSALLNVLAYNTHYSMVYDNFAVNESFLDTAFKRSSVISHASLLNYIPRSYVSAEAKLNITVSYSGGNGVQIPDILTIPSYTAFQTTVSEKTYTFYTKSDISVARTEGNQFVFENVPIYEGRYVEQVGTFTGDYFQCFQLKNQKIDSSSIVVLVDEQTETNVFTKAEDILKVDGNSKVYFLKMNPDGSFQIQFGNGSIGQALKNGDIVTISYLVCNGSSVNGARQFILGDSFGTGSTVQINCVQSASGGAEPEDTDSIRMNAPRLYTTQNRLVTENDYQYTVGALFENARAVKAWGGQKMNPPQYGKVYISVITKNGDNLTKSEKKYILDNIIKPRQVLCNLPEFLDPEYIRVQVISTVYYDNQKTTYTKSDIETLVKNEIIKFNEETLGGFDTVMRYSKLCSAIDGAENSIQNNNTRIVLFYDLNPMYNVMSRYTVNLNNPIHRTLTPSESVISEGFYCTDAPSQVCYIDDNPTNGKLRLFYKNAQNEKVIVRSVGTIDYTNGVIDIEGLNVQSIDGETLRLRINPSSNDVVSEMNQFSMIDPKLMEITAVPKQAEYLHTASK